MSAFNPSHLPDDLRASATVSSAAVIRCAAAFAASTVVMTSIAHFSANPVPVEGFQYSIKTQESLKMVLAHVGQFTHLETVTPKH